MDADGANAHQLTRTDAGVVDNLYAWSPDGRWIAYPYWSQFDEAKDGVYLIAVDNSAERRLTTGLHVVTDWSPAGDQIVGADVDSQEMFIADSTYGYLQVIGGTQGAHPRWSPDGRWIAFMGTTDQLAVWNLAAVPPAAPITISADPVVAGAGPQQIAWAPGSDRIAFVTGDDHPRLKLVTLDGTGERFLTDGTAAFEYEPQWSPNARYIAYSAEAQIRLVEVSTGETRVLANDAYYPHWQRR